MLNMIRARHFFATFTLMKMATCYHYKLHFLQCKVVAFIVCYFMFTVTACVHSDTLHMVPPYLLLSLVTKN